MSTAWVAGSVRARALARRRIGPDGARAMATAGGLAEAVDLLARSAYGHGVRPGDTLVAASRGIADTVLWNLRVLAGWLPPKGADAIRVLLGGFEIANVQEHIRALSGRPTPPPFRLGVLATVWPRLSATSSLDDLRTQLAASPWGDPGASGPRDIELSMTLVWMERVAGRIAPARSWALGAAALIVAREILLRREPLPPQAAASARRLLGTGWMRAATLTELRAGLVSPARRALDGLSDEHELWRAETRWWERLQEQAEALLAGSGTGLGPVVAVAAALAADAHRARAALEVAARADSRGTAHEMA
jgi:hypothetical protein